MDATKVMTQLLTLLDKLLIAVLALVILAACVDVQMDEHCVLLIEGSFTPGVCTLQHTQNLN